MFSEAEMLTEIQQADIALTARYRQKLLVNCDLDRRLVSFQANKAETGNRWFKYKEGFSAELMHYLFEAVGINSGHLLEPFAGSGTALFEAAKMGMDATGIELLPGSVESIGARRLLQMVEPGAMAAVLRRFLTRRAWEQDGPLRPFQHITITKDAFPEETQRHLCRYLYEADNQPDADMGRVLKFAALCVLESISYTRKDGQYLRWDYRSGRRQGARPFNKGAILSFTEAITRKITEIADDLCASVSHFPSARSCPAGNIRLLSGSCLEILPTLPDASFDGIVTSPPYANRYDYTRTYALELAMLNVDEVGVKKLRQTLLSCTVENKAKDHLAAQYPPEQYGAALAAFESQEILQLILRYLEQCKVNKTLNNAGIPRMVRGYFVEMALVIFQCARVLRPGSPFVMVNDNARYMGAHIPVDLILSDFAAAAGFNIEKIWTLPRGKGNSSQQMGTHGREEIRKCVYVWRRNALSE